MSQRLTDEEFMEVICAFQSQHKDDGSIEQLIITIGCRLIDKQRRRLLELEDFVNRTLKPDHTKYSLVEDGEKWSNYLQKIQKEESKPGK